MTTKLKGNDMPHQFSVEACPLVLSHTAIYDLWIK